jgi:hypothetical protein
VSSAKGFGFFVGIGYAFVGQNTHKRASVVFLVIEIFVAIFLFEEMVTNPANLDILVTQSIEVAVIAALASIVILIVRRFRSSLSVYAGLHVATV